MQHNDQKLIHIMGMYKSGTSWLLHVLAAHPDAIAWREFDIIRAVYANQPGPMPSRAINRLRRLLKLPPSKVRKQEVVLREREDIIKELFCGRGLLPIMDETARNKADDLNFENAEQFLNELLTLGEYKLQPDEAPVKQPAEFDNTLGVVNVRQSDLLTFITAAQETADVADIPGHYFLYLQRQCAEGTPIVLKAADQIMCFEQLQASSPDSTKIVIMRDGRDAAISALHYGKLMNKWDAPWKPRELSYEDRLRAWATRASALAQLCATEDILVLRYEDLQQHFHRLCESLFRHLGLSHDRATIDAIYEKTNFSAVTGGRKPGQEAEDIVRKGISGEWKQALTSDEQQLAWRIAHQQLEEFGYAEDGSYRHNPYCEWYLNSL